MGNHDFDAIGNRVWLRANADLSHPAIQRKLLKDETDSFLGGSLLKSLIFTLGSAGCESPLRICCLKFGANFVV